MKSFAFLILAGALACSAANAQTSASAQAGASSSADVKAGGAQAGAQQQSGASAAASQSSQSSAQKDEKTHKASSSAAAASSSAGSASAGPNALNLNNGSTVNADLLTTLDAKKCKPGDKVEARTTQDVKQDGQVVLKKGSRLHGHVTQAQARSKQTSESTLGVVFDNATLKNGQEVPLHLGVQALAASTIQTAASAQTQEPMAMGGGSATGAGRAPGGGLLSGAGGTVGGATGATGGVAGSAGQTVGGAVGSTTHAAGNVAGSSAGSVGGLDASGHLLSSSSGVFGMQGLNLTSAAGSATQADSVISSTSQNVHLASGTQMLLRATNQ